MMFDIPQETLDRLLEEKIPADDYAKVMDMADNLNMEIDEDDPADAFKQAIIQLNDAEELPSYLAEYCTKYDIGHEMPELELPEKNFSV